MTINHFDVVQNPFQQSRKARPFYLCVQHSQLNHLHTRVMAPLAAAADSKNVSRLHPQLIVDGVKVFLDPTDLVTMDIRRLGKPVANLEAERYRIIAALDLVFTGV